MKKCTVAIAGLGSRGLHAYAECAEKYPDKMEIAAVADLRPERIEMAVSKYGVPAENCFSSAEEMLEKERLADAMFICTQDRQHVRHAIAAMRKGYHILLEKPISPDIEECREILKVAEEEKRTVLVCHVLRYTPFFGKLKELLDLGVIGEITTISHTENVVYWHQAHSFVRGNWRRSDETSPMILAKCCHDTDMLLWLSGKHCRSVSSIGNTFLFRKDKAPEGAALRCMDGCKAKENCPYDAEKIYLTNDATGVLKGKTGWPCDILADVPDEQNIREAIEKGPYGRCVYACDNNVVDHQIINMDMEDGSTFSLIMCGFTKRGGRDTRVMGTMGEIIAHMDENTIEVMPFAGENYVIDVSKLADDFSGHGGGDVCLVEEFLDIISGRTDSTVRTTSLKDSLESHFTALAAERSRVNGGEKVYLSELTGE